MTIDTPSRKALWGRSASICAESSCRRDLIPRTDETTGARLSGAGILIGEEAHIRAASRGGPRFDSNYSPIDSYENLILLCPTHHTMIDKNGGEDWPVSRLDEMKRSHEAWVRERLSLDSIEELQIQVLVAAEVERVDDLIIRKWESVYWPLTQAIPSVGKAPFEGLMDAGRLLLAKDWPDSFPRIIAASNRLRKTLSLLGEHIHDAYEPQTGDGRLRLDRPETRLHSWDPPLHQRLSLQTHINMAASWWLADALAEDLNYWIRAVRAEVDRHYRFAEGALLSPIGDGVVSPIRYARLEHPQDGSVPTQPHSLEQLTRAIERAATAAQIEPHELHPSQVHI